MTISKVWIEEDCTACGLCEDICPDVFKVEDIAEIVEGSDIQSYEQEIKEAAETCPVEVIKYE
ncbi:MAG: ferredoxin [Salinivirgaceae bacterium]|nr:ferredoxin [Salinivirgaceae bacterium]